MTYCPVRITLMANIKNKTKNIILTAGIDHKKKGKVLKNKNIAPVTAITLFLFIVSFIVDYYVFVKPGPKKYN